MGRVVAISCKLVQNNNLNNNNTYIIAYINNLNNNNIFFNKIPGGGPRTPPISLSDNVGFANTAQILKKRSTEIVYEHTGRTH